MVNNVNTVNMVDMVNILLQEAPAETTWYMVFGYTVIFGTMIFYLASLITRWRNLKKDQEVLEELEKDQK